MADSNRILDESVKDEVLHYPTVEMIRRIFPDVRMRGRSVLCNPLRDDRNPSMSCFRDRNGIPRWKDFATEESGDNIDFFRLVYPELDYVEAVDRLALLVLGRSALQDGVTRKASILPRTARRMHVPAKEQAPVLEIVSDSPLFSAGTPSTHIDYVRGRAISDEVSSRYGRCVVYENSRLKGMMRKDPVSGLPIIGADGKPELQDGRFTAVAIPNDVGGYSLRVPDTGSIKGFKGCNVAFVSTILADGSSPQKRVSFVGQGDGLVTHLHYDESSKTLHVSDRQAFKGVEPWAAQFAVPFLDVWTGRYLEGRDLRGAVAVLNSLNGPVNTVATVVEGLFDALSVIEIHRLLGKGAVPGTDLVVLNGVTNLSWAVPFLSMHTEVRSLLDNDLRSGAGQRTFSVMAESVAAYCGRCGVSCNVRSDSAYFKPYKDVNEYLMTSRGFRSAGPVKAGVEKKK